MLRPSTYEQRLATFLKQTFQEKDRLIEARKHHDHETALVEEQMKQVEIQKAENRKRNYQKYVHFALDNLKVERETEYEIREKARMDEIRSHVEEYTSKTFDSVVEMSIYRDMCQELPVPQEMYDYVITKQDGSKNLADYDQSTGQPICNGVLNQLFTTLQPKTVIEDKPAYIKNACQAKVRAVILGPPCSGKTSLINNLLSSNDKMHHITLDSALKKSMKSGQLNSSELEKDYQSTITDEFLCKVVCDVIAEVKEDEGFIIENFPTSAVQASILEKLLTGNGIDRAEPMQIPSFNSESKVFENEEYNNNRLSAFQTIIFIEKSDAKTFESLKTETFFKFDIEKIKTAFATYGYS